MCDGGAAMKTKNRARTVTVSLPEDLEDWAKNRAFDLRITFSAYMRMIIENAKYDLENGVKKQTAS